MTSCFRRSFLLSAALALGHIEPTIVADAFLVPSTPSAAPSCLSATTPADEAATIPAITERMLALTKDPAVAIVIDVENVRGKTNFELDHADLLDRLAVWTSLRHRAAGRTIAVVDHGSRSSAHLLQGHGAGADDDGGGVALCVAFAGPHVKADDVIARDVGWMLSSSNSTVQHVVVITADQELAWRCRSAAWAGDGAAFNAVLRKLATDNGFAAANDVGGRGGGKQRKKKGGRNKSRAARKRQYLQRQEEEKEEEEDPLDPNASDADAKHNGTITDVSVEQKKNETGPTVEVIAPQRFLEDLEQALLEWLHQQEAHPCAEVDIDAPIPINNIPIPTPVTTLQTLFHLRGQILSLESALRKKCSLHKRHTLTGELRKCKEEWKETLSSIATADGSDGMDASGKQSLVSSLAWSLSSSIASWDDDGIDNATMPQLSPLPSSSSMSWDELSPLEQEKLLLRWGKRRGRQGTRREKTEDRIVLAERLRRQLELILDTTEKVKGEASLAHFYADHINSM